MFSGLPSKVQPLRCMICEAAQMPQRMHTSNDFFCTYCDKKPPTKASPAPFVSTICSCDNSCTGNSSILPLRKSKTVAFSSKILAYSSLPTQPKKVATLGFCKSHWQTLKEFCTEPPAINSALYLSISSLYNGICFSSAKIASLGLRPYFLRKSSSTVAEMSSKGLPQPTRMPSLQGEDHLGHIVY
ncbi:hypothetical protein FF38_11976 [Lucilia cuprina]|uniref:Uncharacterized protein n=1 Tax=Lucilia cuprina TaxID=7375 RepID=A0A0L0CEB3_LUCCU|nr:hypothetical protein FF38_11976 [Lucilia cuprina]